MNNQLNKGVIELFILLLLKRKDNYGYELTKISANNLNITEGAVYPVLRRLAKQGYLKAYQKIENKREKKYYHITDEGLQRLKRLLEEWKVIEMAIANYM
ncbi:PadR family transcriptional regulator [Pediococcus acidilactici]|uniref:PadR family transcriptional regulator n=1 Tax=Pediococcus acidilactici TaxID=1254 RepID=UPI00186A516D|nr:PadR family transcriptional regulator [Pediococcus acidilactici]MCH9266061.1 PadR family transcriptional regulator [Pediococcus acidilactici]MCK2073199.1 PadR family transcriptional regulator [Pediococcus acidilactici]MDV2602957.1 PadR family transcriptional regulator [Pediococcus acidilactici]MDV2844379.1 PadR family transcriptional regulator [Pediococcus acidilactici]QOP73471.1 PadR family transcriptional regulator [Pediococcus acidilactici]